MTDVAAARRLGVRATVAQVCRITLRNPRTVVRLALAPMAFFLAARLAEPLLARTGSPAIDTPTSLGFFLTMGLGLLGFATVVPMMTAWHRLADDGGADSAYRFGDAEWRYLWKAALFVLLAFVGALPVTTMIGTATGYFLAATADFGAVREGVKLLPFLVYVALAATLVRIAPVLAATAADEPLDIGQAWRATRGNGWSIAVTATILYAPAAAAWAVVEAMDPGGGVVALVVTATLRVAVTLIWLAQNAVLWSLVWRASWES